MLRYRDSRVDETSICTYSLEELKKKGYKQLPSALEE